MRYHARASVRGAALALAARVLRATSDEKPRTRTKKTKVKRRDNENINDNEFCFFLF
jgi:hypothetical protein